MKFIAFSDAAVFGGHEAMSVHAIQSLISAGHEVIAVVFKGNENFIVALRDLDVEIVLTEISHQWIHSFGFIFSRRDFRYLRDLFLNSGASCCILLQGRIETCRLGLSVAKSLGMFCLSYIPFAHPRAVVTGRTFVGGVQDLLNGAAYRQIDGFITCYEKAQSDIFHWHPKARVEIVQNVARQISASEMVPAFGGTLKSGSPVFALLGRVEFRQKRQDWFVNTVPTIIRNFPEATFWMIGDGPDFVELQQLVAHLGLNDRVMLFGWSHDPMNLLIQADLLVLPSQFEGMPLSMLEAALLGIPVVGSAVDGIKEFLPAEWTFDLNDISGMIKALNSALAPSSTQRRRQLQEKAARLDAVSFGRNFSSAVEALLP